MSRAMPFRCRRNDDLNDDTDLQVVQIWAATRELFRLMLGTTV